MNVSVVGAGYVGLVTAACLSEAGNSVVCVDVDRRKIEALNDGVIPIYEPGLAELVLGNSRRQRLHFTTELQEAVGHGDIIFLAVGTPGAADGSADISQVLDVSGRIAELMAGYKIIATKSTVPVGTHRKVAELIRSKTDIPFDYVSNPEFLKEGAAVDDFMSPDRIIIGTESDRARQTMKRLYSPFMRRGNRIIFMDPASAEMAKYAANTMLATRISLMNEIAELCEKVGADIEMVRRGIGSDRRIGNAFLFAGIGYGGSCFPKDVRALIHTGRQHGAAMKVAAAVQEVNQAARQRFAERVVQYFAGQAKRVVLCVWGLAFKARTDDVRESAAVYCVRRFAEAGLKVRAYDPEASAHAAEVLKGAFEPVDDAYGGLDGADALVVLTDWQEFRTPNFDEVAQRLKRRVIFDGRNLYDPNVVRNAGIEYHSVGRASVFP